jgi:hypothetical protein
MTHRILPPALRLAASNTMRERPAPALSPLSSREARDAWDRVHSQPECAEPHPRTAAADLIFNADPTGERRLLTEEELASIMPVHDFAPVAKIEPRIWDQAFGPEDEEQRGGGVILVLVCGAGIPVVGLIGVAIRWGFGL